MNLTRTLSRHQLMYLKEVCSGELVIRWVEEFQAYAELVFIDKDGEETFRTYGTSKPRGKQLMVCGNHLGSSIVELRQRRLLVDINGRLMPSKNAAKEFGAPPPIPPAPRPSIKMSRTRPARTQHDLQS